MSLMYPVSSELTGPSKMKTKYTLNVAFSGLGVILGPVLSGFHGFSFNLTNLLFIYLMTILLLKKEVYWIIRTKTTIPCSR
jgi:hypothetical protein